MKEAKNEMDQELAAAQEAVAVAKKKLALAEEARLSKAAADLAAHKAAEEKRLFDQRKEQERIQNEWAARRAKEEEDKRTEAAAREAEQRRLERELATRQAEAKAEADRQENVRKIQEQAKMLEDEAKRIEAELLRPTARVNELELDQNQPGGIHDPRNPISRHFGVVAPEPTREAPAAEEAKQVTLREVNYEEAGKLVDYIIYQSGVRVDRTELTNMLSRFSYEVVESTFTTVLAQHKVKRMTGIEIAASMQALLAGHDAPAPVDPETVQCPTCHVRVPRSLAKHDGHIVNPRSAQAAGLISAADCERLLSERGAQ